MKHDYFPDEFNSIYDQEQAVFAKMKERERISKRRKRRRYILLWILRRL
jgi:hypothetical protein